MLQEEIAEEVEVNNFEVLTPTGFKPVTHAYKTIPMQPWILKTEDFGMECAGKHIVQTHQGLSYVEDLKVGDVVDTEKGYQTVKECYQKDCVPEPMYDFSVDSEDHLYYTNGIVSHNSTSFTARDLILTKLLPGFSSLYIAPQSQQTKTYADRLQEMYSMFRFPVPNSKYRQNLYLREFPGGSKIKLENALTSADHIRGNTADQNLYDEYQGFDINLQPEIDMTMTDSDFDITIYSGTSTTVDTALEARYQEGSQGVWHVQDPAGGWIDCSDPKVVLPLIQSHGFVSPKTNIPLDVRRGVYVHGNEQALQEGRLSVHVPQIIIPRMVESPERWAKIYQKKISPNFDDKAFLQEVLGIATEEGARELTESHLREVSTLDFNKCKEDVLNNKYYATVSACDWGGSDYNPQLKTKLSYTVHVVLGIRYDKRSIDILYARRYSGMDYETIVDSIMHHHNLYKCMAISSDFGVGMLYNFMIRKRLSNAFNHIVMQYTGPKTTYMGIAKSQMENHLCLNKTESLTEIFKSIKTGRIHCFDWKDSADFMMEFLNVIRVVSDNKDGTNKTFTYIRHGSKADDFVHAVNFGYTLCRMILGEAMCEDEGTQAAVEQLVRGGTFNKQSIINNYIPPSVSG